MEPVSSQLESRKFWGTAWSRPGAGRHPVGDVSILPPRKKPWRELQGAAWQGGGAIKPIDFIGREWDAKT